MSSALAKTLIALTAIATSLILPVPTRAQSEQLAIAERLNSEVIELYSAGRYGEAIPLATRALAIREKVLGPEHPNTATSLNNLGVLYDATGAQNDLIHTTGPRSW
jgi:Tetratricopeptide repeat